MRIKNQFPRQDIPENEKDEKWCIQHLDFATYLLIQRNYYYNRKITEYFNQYNGLSNANTYKYLTEAYGKKNRTKFIDYRLGKAKIDLLNGEFIDRPIRSTVYTINSEAVAEKQDQYLVMIGASLAKKELGVLKQNGLDPMEGLEVPDIDDEEGWKKVNFKNKNEAIMQIIINETLASDDTKTKLANDFLNVELASMCWGKVFMKDNGEAAYQSIDPRDAIFVELNNDPFIKRSMIRGQRKRLTVAEILNEYDLTDEQRQKLQYLANNKSDYLNGDYGRYSPFSMDNGEFTIDVLEVEWDSVEPVMTKLIPSKTNPDVRYKQDLIVEKYYENRIRFDKQFEKDKVEVVTQYRQVVWEATRIGIDIHINCRKKPFQMFFEDDPSRIIGGAYTGMLFNTVNGTRVPLSETIDNLSRMYNATMYQINRELAKFHGNILGFDEASLPKGKSVRDMLYEAINDGLLRYNSSATGNLSSTNPNVNRILQQIDMGFSNSFSVLIQLRTDIATTLDKLTGINNDRQGMTSASSTVTNAQQNISASRAITAPMFYMFERYIENILTRMAEMTKLHIVYKGSKKWESILGSEKYGFLRIDPEIVKYNFGVHIADSTKEQRLRQRMEMLSQYALNSKEVRYVDVMEAEAQESISDAIAVMQRGWETVQKVNAEQQAAASQQQMQLQQQASQAQYQQALEDREDRQAHEVELARIKKGLDVIQDSLSAQNELTTQNAAQEQEMLNQQAAQSAQIM